MAEIAMLGMMCMCGSAVVGGGGAYYINQQDSTTTVPTTTAAQGSATYTGQRQEENLNAASANMTGTTNTPVTTETPAVTRATPSMQDLKSKTINVIYSLDSNKTKKRGIAGSVDIGKTLSSTEKKESISLEKYIRELFIFTVYNMRELKHELVQKISKTKIDTFEILHLEDGKIMIYDIAYKREKKLDSYYLRMDDTSTGECRLTNNKANGTKWDIGVSIRPQANIPSVKFKSMYIPSNKECTNGEITTKYKFGCGYSTNNISWNTTTVETITKQAGGMPRFKVDTKCKYGSDLYYSYKEVDNNNSTVDWDGVMARKPNRVLANQIQESTYNNKDSVTGRYIRDVCFSSSEIQDKKQEQQKQKTADEREKTNTKMKSTFGYQENLLLHNYAILLMRTDGRMALQQLYYDKDQNIWCFSANNDDRITLSTDDDGGPYTNLNENYAHDKIIDPYTHSVYGYAQFKGPILGGGGGDGCRIGKEKLGKTEWYTQDASQCPYRHVGENKYSCEKSGIKRRDTWGPGFISEAYTKVGGLVDRINFKCMIGPYDWEHSTGDKHGGEDKKAKNIGRGGKGFRGIVVNQDYKSKDNGSMWGRFGIIKHNSETEWSNDGSVVDSTEYSDAMEIANQGGLLPKTTAWIDKEGLPGSDREVSTRVSSIETHAYTDNWHPTAIQITSIQYKLQIINMLYYHVNGQQYILCVGNNGVVYVKNVDTDEGNFGQDYRPVVIQWEGKKCHVVSLTTDKSGNLIVLTLPSSDNPPAWEISTHQIYHWGKQNESLVTGRVNKADFVFTNVGDAKGESVWGMGMQPISNHPKAPKHAIDIAFTKENRYLLIDNNFKDIYKSSINFDVSNKIDIFKNKEISCIKLVENYGDEHETIFALSKDGKTIHSGLYKSGTVSYENLDYTLKNTDDNAPFTSMCIIPLTKTKKILEKTFENSTFTS